MLNSILEGIENAAKSKLRFAKCSFDISEKNDALVDDVINELSKRGFTARCILFSGKPFFNIEVTF